eukprot:11797375-Ditylum_brightwellii.AAC.1
MSATAPKPFSASAFKTVPASSNSLSIISSSYPPLSTKATTSFTASSTSKVTAKPTEKDKNSQ